MNEQPYPSYTPVRPYEPAPQLYHAEPPPWPAPPRAPYPPSYVAPTYVAPTYVYPPPAYPPRASVTYLPRQTSHGLHLFLTIVTGGAWGLVWLGVALAHRYGARQEVRTYHA